jgi:phage recombination protein Bet
MENEIVKYLTSGGDIELSPDIIRAYLVPPDSKITDAEMGFFLRMCKFQRLNPFMKEIYIVKYGSYPAAFIVGKDTFLRRARKNETYEGHTVAISDDGQLAWAEVHVKGFKHPVRCEVELSEYVGTKADGTVNSMWEKKPKTMLKKVALVQALREAFPQECGGMYDAVEQEDKEEELKDVQAKVVTVAQTKTSQEKGQKKDKKKTTGSAQSNAKKTSDTKPPEGSSGEVHEILSKIKNITKTTGGDPDKPWTRFNIESVGGTIYTTFDKNFADDASKIKGSDLEALLQYVIVNKNGIDYFNLVDKVGLTLV